MSDKPIIGGKPYAGGLLRRSWTVSRLGRAWAQLLRFDGGAGLGKLVDLVVSNEFCRTKQLPSELTALGDVLLGLRPEVAMEIGTWWGGTLFFLTRLAGPHATIVSVDLPGGQADGGGYSSRRAWLYRRFARPGQRVFTLRGDSHSSEMLERVRATLRGKRLDYLFIDGDHTYDGVKRDFELYGPLVRGGGIIAFHDIVEHPPGTPCEVSRFWQEVKPGHRHTEIIENSRQGWAGIGVLYVS